MPPDGDKPNLKDKDVLLQSDCRIHSSIPLRTQHHSVRGCCHGNRSSTSVPCFCMHYAFTLKKHHTFPRIFLISIGFIGLKKSSFFSFVQLHHSARTVLMHSVISTMFERHPILDLDSENCRCACVFKC